MKHAYLIIAHNEFEHLQRLISALDDERNDIYVHIDRKVKQLPKLHVTKSKLTVLDRRIDVRWGTRSQIRVEYALFEAATSEGKYEYYHLISGTHFPLKTQNEIHKWFEKHIGRSVLASGYRADHELRFKLGYYHFFLRWIKSRNRYMAKASNLLWRISLRFQRGIIKRNYEYAYEKCPNWISLNHAAVNAVIKVKNQVLRQMRYTFCGDEIFVPAILHNANIAYDKSEHLLFADFLDLASPIVLKASDFDRLVESGCLFARKFSSESTSLTDLIEKECLALKSQS